MRGEHSCVCRAGCLERTCVNQHDFVSWGVGSGLHRECGLEVVSFRCRFYMAAEHMLDFCSAVRLLLDVWKAPPKAWIDRAGGRPAYLPRNLDLYLQ